MRVSVGENMTDRQYVCVRVSLCLCKYIYMYICIYIYICICIYIYICVYMHERKRVCGFICEA
jgi:hypothetical protein